MTWLFDQAPNAACIASSTVMAGAPVLVVTHYEEDHSWAFLDGQSFDPSEATVVAMSTVIDLHPELSELASLPPGWTASRAVADGVWSKRQDLWAPNL